MDPVNCDLNMFLCELWALERNILLSDKYDQLITRITETIINTNDSNELKNHHMLNELLTLKSTMPNVDLKSTALSCKCVVNYLIKQMLSQTNMEHQIEDTFLKTIAKSLECVILAEDTEFCEQLIHLLLNELPDEGGISQHIRTNIVIFTLDCVLNVMNSTNLRPKLNNTNLIKILQDKCLHERVTCLLLKSYQKVSTPYIMLNIVPKLVELSKTNTIVKTLWSNLASPDESSAFNLSHTMYILCSLADFFISTSKDSIQIFLTDEYWRIIQTCLVSDNPLLRKQGLYLLKRTNDSLISSKTNVELEVFSWKFLSADSLIPIWERYFILLEVVEEKQSHLVTPVIKSIFKPSEHSKYMHPSWNLIVCSRLLSHDSLQVVKTGIISFLQLDIQLHFNMLYKEVVKILISKLNNMLLYSRNPNNSEWSELDLSLKDWFSRIIVERDICKELFCCILDGLTKVSWCTIPLFHILHSISVLPSVELFDETHLSVFYNFLNEVTRTQNVFVRGAVQCAVLNIITTKTKKNISTFHIANMMGIFRQNECLKRGLISWKTAEKWIVECLMVNKDLFEELFCCENSLPAKSKARCLVLFFDSGLIIHNSEIEFSFSNYFSCLKDTHVRPYACIEESDKCIDLLFNILQESQYFQKGLGPKEDVLIKLMQPYIKEVIPYFNKRLFEVNQLINFDIIECYVQTLKTVIENKLANILELRELNNHARKIALSLNYSLVQRYFGVKIVMCCINSIKEQCNMEDIEHIKEFSLSIIKNDHLLQKQIRDSNIEKLSRNHQINWGRLVSQFTCALWTVLLECIEAQFLLLSDIFSVINSDSLVKLAINSIDSGGRDPLVPILGVMKHVLQSASRDSELVNHFLDITWKSCFELRKVYSFWPSLSVWIKMAFNEIMIENIKILPVLIKFSDELMTQGETVVGVSNLLLSHLLINIKCALSVKDVLTRALLFGPILRRDQRIEDETCSLIRSLGSDYAVNDLIPETGSQSSYEVRACSLAILLRAHDSYGHEGEQLLIEVVHQLIERDKKLTAQRQRYHGDSLHHRIKHRILQALLVLETKLAQSSSHQVQSCISDLVMWSSSSLQGESQQPSVRYQLEWLLVRSLIHSSLVHSFWDIFSQASEERTGSICSFISVAYHLAVSQQDADFIDRCITQILPWCMAQHFNVRLYAQVVLQKLLSLDSNIACKYQVICNSIAKSINQGNAIRNAEKLKNDFYFTAFHPLEHFSLETIFWELPRLSNIARDEWVTLSAIKKYFRDDDPSIPVTNTNSLLKQFNAATWVVKATENEVVAEASGLQKKYVPWKSMFSDESSEHLSRTELIVVASLIDKLPNLGGLARSSEVFAVQALTVPSLEYTQDKLFSTLSMTAEKHINILEVKPHDLPQYLRTKKQSGYTLVGAEQTAASVSLETYKFPRKCLLLLGNEKEGVPANLLPLLDVCVEVRQLGLVRSLNVHVTGALFIWEYTRQYLAGGNLSTSQR